MNSMRLPALLFCLPLLTALPFAQSERGGIAGAVSDPAGVIVSKATVQAKNAKTGEVFKAVSSPDGQYTLADLPAGTYDISVNLPGLKGYERKGVAVQAAKTAPLEIRLEEGTQLSTLGEDTLAIAADARKHAAPPAPAARTKD